MITLTITMTQTVTMTESSPKPVPCAICKENDSAQPYKPFCSARCANVDLHRWLGGHYSVPAVEPPDNFSEPDHLSEDDDTFGDIH